MTKKFKKGLVITFVTVALFAFASNLILFKYMEGFSPQKPNVATGEIYQQNDHGYYFYIDHKSYVIQKILWYVFGIFAIGAALLEYRWRTMYNSYDDLPKKLY